MGLLKGKSWFEDENDNFLPQYNESKVDELEEESKEEILKKLAVKFLNEAAVSPDKGLMRKLTLELGVFRIYKKFLKDLVNECPQYFANVFLRLCFDKMIANLDVDQTVENYINETSLRSFLQVGSFETQEAKVKAAHKYYSEFRIFDQHRKELINLIAHVIPHINSNVEAKVSTVGYTFIDNFITPPHGTVIDLYDGFVSTTLDKIDPEPTDRFSEVETVEMERECEEIAKQDMVNFGPTAVQWGRNSSGELMAKVGIYEAEAFIEENLKRLGELQVKVNKLIKLISSEETSNEEFGELYDEISKIKFNQSFNLAQYIDRQVRLLESNIVYEQFDPVKHSLDTEDAKASNGMRFADKPTIKVLYGGKDKSEIQETEYESEVETADLHRIKPKN